ncbi:DUF2244 domain-containing protein [Emcibacter sp.]|uniref:DUF2244 domain-containing protein n=1 Tax=Emcibacter sp. TaxID=1979954 RepID=UPI002AA8C7E1|nr:DUF2244 domain-containing protein [Emcibacter sp.]
MQESTDKIWFDATLYPHRSLGPKGFLILMTLVSIISFVIGLIFFLKGAWPVFGFMGLDVLLIYVAFKLNYRSGRLVETISLIGDELVVRRIDHKGDEQAWSFNPYWVRLALEYRKKDPQAMRQRYLLISSHGRGLFVGEFLTEEERKEFSLDLDNAIRRYKSGANPATA